VSNSHRGCFAGASLVPWLVSHLSPSFRGRAAEPEKAAQKRFEERPSRNRPREIRTGWPWNEVRRAVTPDFAYWHLSCNLKTAKGTGPLWQFDDAYRLWRETDRCQPLVRLRHPFIGGFCGLPTWL